MRCDVVSLLCPGPIHLISLIPRMVKLLICKLISAPTCVVFPVSDIILKSHVLMLMVVLVEVTISSWVSRRIRFLPLGFIPSTAGDPSSP